MAQFEQWFAQDFTEKIEIRHCESVMFSGDDKGAVVGVRLFNGGAEYAGGGTVSGKVIRSDGAEVALTGTISGNAASVVLLESCLAVPGPIGVYIRLTADSQKATVLSVIYTVQATSTGTIVDPGTIIPSVTDLIDDIEQAVSSIPADYTALLAAVAPTFSATAQYHAGYYVWYNGELYQYKTNHDAGSWAAAEAVKVPLSKAVGEMQDETRIYQYLTNNGQYTVTAADMEDGAWSYSSKVNNTKRIRNANLIPVRAGMQIAYSTPTLRLGFWVLASKTSTGSFAQTIGFQDTGSSGIINITADGYLIILADSANNITVSDYDCSVVISTVFNDALGELGNVIQNSRNDLIYNMNRGNGTMYGVSFVRDKVNKTITLNGTVDSNRTSTFSNLSTTSDGIPNGIIPGKTYDVEFSAPDDRVSLQFTFYDNNNDTISTFNFKTAKTFTVPDNTKNINIRIYVDASSGKSRVYSNYVVTLSLYRNFDYTLVRSDTDFNNLTSPGIFAFLGTHQHSHCPDGFVYGFVDVQSVNYATTESNTNTNNSIIIQQAFPMNSNAEYSYAFRKYVFSNNAWGPWQYYIDIGRQAGSSYDLMPDYTLSNPNFVFEKLDWNKYHVTGHGTSSGTNIIQNVFSNVSAIPSYLEKGKQYYFKFSATLLTVSVAVYFNNDAQDYIFLGTNQHSSFFFTIPENATGFYISLRVNGTASVDEILEYHILNYLDNETLQNYILAMSTSKKCPTNIIRRSLDDTAYLIRASYSPDYDIVYSVGIPNQEEGRNRVFSFRRDFTMSVLIPASTPVEDTAAAITSQTAIPYKDMHDEIPAMCINGVFVGANHGNPNYTAVYCTHTLDETYIGTVWADTQSNQYTLVNVLAGLLVFGTLDGDGKLIVRDPAPSSLTYNGITITPTSVSEYQLRRSAINNRYTILNDSGEDVSNGGGGNNIIITEDYDINDQSAGLLYLQQHVGSNTNASYYDDGQTPVMCHITNTFIFNRNGSMTVYGSMIAKENLIDNILFGGMSYNFPKVNGYNYLYVPNSLNCKNIKQYVGNAENMYVTKDNSGIMHYRYYEIADISVSSGNGFFVHLLDMGSYDEEKRKEISTAAYNSAAANKFYTQLQNEEYSMAPGDVLSWGYGRGPFVYSADQTVLSWFDYNGGYIVSMDWHNNYDGLAKLPYYMAGKKIEILEKTDSVTVKDEIVTNVGVRVEVAGGYGYVVFYAR